MIVFLDANSIIYSLQQPPVWGAKATARIAAFRAANDSFAVSDLVRMECLIGPMKSGDALLLAAFRAYFSLPDVQVFPITASVCDRAAAIRATHGFKSLDALHLAAAVEHACDHFLTADAQLLRFPDVPMELLS